MHTRATPSPILKKTKPITGHGTVLEGWLDKPCKIHTTPDIESTHSLRHNELRVLTVFETFASNNRRKRALRDLVEVCQVATINLWNDTAITFNASDEPKIWSVRAPAALASTQLWMAFGSLKCSWTVAVD